MTNDPAAKAGITGAAQDDALARFRSSGPITPLLPETEGPDQPVRRPMIPEGGVVIEDDPQAVLVLSELQQFVLDYRTAVKNQRAEPLVPHFTDEEAEACGLRWHNFRGIRCPVVRTYFDAKNNIVFDVIAVRRTYPTKRGTNIECTLGHRVQAPQWLQDKHVIDKTVTIHEISDISEDVVGEMK